SRHFGVLRDPIDAEPVADVIEEHIARLSNGPVERNIAMASLQMTGEIVAIKRSAARTMEIRFVVDDPGLKSGQRHNRLECRTRSKLGLNGAIHQRLVGIAGNGLPVAT